MDQGCGAPPLGHTGADAHKCFHAHNILDFLHLAIRSDIHHERVYAARVGELPGALHPAYLSV